MRLRAQTILFSSAIVLLLAVSVWWTVYIHRSVRAEREAALRELALRHALESCHAGLEPVDLGLCPATNADEDDIGRRYHRRNLMVLGEGGMLFALVCVCMAMLWRLIGAEARRFESMNRFIASVTHEMKTPLAGLRSLLQTARAGGLPEDRKEEIMTMGLGEAERLEHMIENVLTSGRLRTDSQPVRSSMVRLGEFLEGFARHRRGILGRPESLVLVHGGGAAEKEVLMDPDGMRVVLENLVDNAYKYGGDDPEVRVESRDEGSRIVIEVSDRGIGFDPGEAEAIFRPFQRSIAGGSSSHGTGLGLSIARALARRMGGDVTAASDGPGRGSRFGVWLPVRPHAWQDRRAPAQVV